MRLYQAHGGWPSADLDQGRLSSCGPDWLSPEFWVQLLMRCILLFRYQEGDELQELRMDRYLQVMRFRVGMRKMHFKKIEDEKKKLINNFVVNKLSMKIK